MTTPAALATVARCSGVKSGSGGDFILNIGMPLGVWKLAQLRTRPVIAKPPGLPVGLRSSQTSKSAPLWRRDDVTILCRVAVLAQLHDFGRLAGARRSDDRADALGGLAERVVEQMRIARRGVGLCMS